MFSSGLIMPHPAKFNRSAYFTVCEGEGHKLCTTRVSCMLCCNNVTGHFQFTCIYLPRGRLAGLSGSAVAASALSTEALVRLEVAGRVAAGGSALSRPDGESPSSSVCCTSGIFATKSRRKSNFFSDSIMCFLKF